MSTRRPIIGITATIEPNFKDEPLMGTDCPYVEAIEAAQGAPVLIPITRSPDAALPLLACLDGILFTGGEDVSPAFYGEPPHEKLGIVNEYRDATELLLAREAFAKRIPILGICRGQQLLNVALGGTLYQDLPSQLPDAQPHQLPSSNGPVSEWSHHIKISPHSSLARALALTEIIASSTHHQAVKNLAPGLSAVAWSGDGVVEAIEAPAYPSFFIAVQSHPERLYVRHVPAWKPLFEGLVRAAAAFKAARQTLPAGPKPG